MSLLNNKFLFVHINKSGGGKFYETYERKWKCKNNW